MKSKALFAAALLLAACSSNNTAANELLEAHLNKLDPLVEVAKLTAEPRVLPDGKMEYTCKVRLRVREDLYESDSDAFRAECLKRGIIQNNDWEGEPASLRGNEDPALERDLSIDREKKLNGTVVLVRKQTKGTEFEVYGTILARRLVDKWEFSPFSSETQPPKLGKPAKAFNDPENGTQGFISGSPELEAHYRLAQSLKAERAKLIENRNAPILKMVAPGSSYCFFLSHGKRLPAVMTFTKDGDRIVAAIALAGNPLILRRFASAKLPIAVKGKNAENWYSECQTARPRLSFVAITKELGRDLHPIFRQSDFYLFESNGLPSTVVDPSKQSQFEYNEFIEARRCDQSAETARK